MGWLVSLSDREYSFTSTRCLTGVQSRPVHDYSHRGVNNRLGLRVAARFGRHGFVILFSLLWGC